MNRLLTIVGDAWRQFERLWLGPVDARVYAIIRIAFAVVALINVIDLWPHRLAFFSGEGMTGHPAEQSGLSVFRQVESPAGVTVIFLVAAASAVWLGIGVMARPAAVLLWLWQMSYTSQGYPLVHGWDILLRIEALILLISPLGPSIPQWLAQVNGKPGAIRRSDGMASRHGLVLLQIQLAVVYWQTVWLKVLDAYWRNGEVISYFMMSTYARFPSAQWAHWDLASALLSHLTLLVEVAIPLLLWNRRTRMLGFFLGIGLHGSIVLVSHILLFSLTVLVPYFAFLDGRDLERWSGRLRRRRILEG
ncbi:MAG: hypothetical protein KDM64_10630 [Verrucomicrobiae bacterium]|nr:hypothetical protein [Verrucomicrobiae bacterium]